LLSCFLSKETFGIVENYAMSVGKSESNEYKIKLDYYKNMIHKK